MLKKFNNPYNYFLIIILSLIIIFINLDEISINYYYKILIVKDYFSYFNLLLLFTIFTPIIFNIIILILLYKIEHKGSINNFNLPSNFLKSFISFLNNIGKDKELLTDYRKKSYTEILFYVIMLLLVICYNIIFSIFKL